MYQYNSQDLYNFVSFLGAKTKRKGDELFFEYCPYCKGGGHDKETMSININTGTFKCFRSSCDKKGHFVELARDFGYNLVSEEQMIYKKIPKKEIIPTNYAIEYLKNRGISEEVINKYKITTQKKHNNVLVFPFYDEKSDIQFIKYRKTDFVKGKDKAKEWAERNTKPILFGMAQCEDFKSLVITEGQIDSLSLAECGVKNAVSVPTGATGFTWLSHCWDWINKFNEIIVFGDNENGHITLIDELSKRIKKPVKCVRSDDYLLEKDANDILRKYGKEAIINAVKNAEIQPIKYIKDLADVENVNIEELPKIKTNIKPLDRAIGGLYYGQVILLSGKRGEGKSTFMSQIVADAIEQNQKVFIYSGELPNIHFKNWLNLQVAGKKHIKAYTNEHNDTKYTITDEVLQKLNNWYRNRVYIFDNTAIKDDEYDGLISVMEESICRYGINLLCIDNLMTAIDDDTSSDVFRQQSIFVKKLAKMAKKYNVVIILIAHPKKTNDGFNNDTVAGSSNITNAVDVVLNYERNLENTDADSKLSVTKNRLTGKLLMNDNAIPLYYSIACKRVQATKEEKEYSLFRKTDEQILDEINDLPF